MGSTLISFRLSDEALRILETRSLPGESINLTAQRILTDILGVTKEKSAFEEVLEKIKDSVIDDIKSSSELRETVHESTAYVVSGVNAKLKEFEDKLKKIEQINQRLNNVEKVIIIVEEAYGIKRPINDDIKKGRKPRAKKLEGSQLSLVGENNLDQPNQE